MPTKVKTPVKPFVLSEWYSSDDAKRNFTRISTKVHERRQTVGLLGSAKHEWLFLTSIDDIKLSGNEYHKTSEEVKGDWVGVMYAALLYRAEFVISVQKQPRVLLYRNDEVDHPAIKYRKSESSDVSSITKMIEEVLKEVRKLSRVHASGIVELASIATRLETSTDIFDRRFRELWRNTNLSPLGLHGSAH